MQTITITGYLSRDAEHGSTQSGQAWARWNIPVKQGWGDKEQTNWFRCTIWGKRADFASKARKGDFATVTGELVIGEYQGKPQYEINVSDFASARTAPRDDAGQGGQPATDTGRSAPPQSNYDDLDDDIPF